MRLLVSELAQAVYVTPAFNSEAREWRHNSDKQNRKVEDLTLFQARKQVFLKQFLKRKLGVRFPPISLRTRLCCLTFAGFQ